MTKQLCPQCKGIPQDDYPCDKCNGTGLVDKSRSIMSAVQSGGISDYSRYAANGANSDNPRQGVIDAFHDVQEVLGDYERGRTSMKAVKQVYNDYRVECHKLKEECFILADIIAMDVIPIGYPVEPCTLPTYSNAFDTPRFKAQREAVNQKLGNK